MGTIRQRLRELLRQGKWNTIELSRELSTQEREVFSHLQHVQKSLSGERLKMEPYCCQSCGYVFSKRSRLDRPGKCPQCKGSHIRMALFYIG